MLRKIRDLRLATKFLGAIALILIVLTFLDISYNSRKEQELTQKEIKRWTFRLAENVRVALNTLMREGKMDIRFSMIQNMKDELEGINEVRIIRAERTNEYFNEMNKKEIIPALEKAISLNMLEMPALEEALSKATEADQVDDLHSDIIELKEDLALLRGKLALAQKVLVIDPRERAKDDLDLRVLEEGKPIYKFNHKYARVLIPYIAERKKCSEATGCHSYAREGDVLGAINIEFSTEEISADIRKNNIWMAAFWVMRFIIFLGIIIILLTIIVTKDIKAMLKVFKKVEDGDFTARAEVRGKDEFGEMSAGFNRMVQSLEETRKELDQRVLEVFALYNIGKAVDSDSELDHILLSLVHGIGKSEKIDKMMIMLADSGGDGLYVASHTGFECCDVESVRFKRGEGFYGHIALTGQGRMIVDVEGGDGIEGEGICGSEVNSIIAVPFFKGEEVFGLICAYRNRPGQFDMSDQKLFEGMAEHLSTVLNNVKLMEETKDRATHDYLTGLYNRSYFSDAVDKELEKALRYGRQLSIFMIDIDNFKHYNDSHGHPEGDKLLIELCTLMKQTLRSIDISCRYGGEEFVVILPETPKDGAVVIAERLVSAISNHPFSYRELQPLGYVSVSVGLATFPEDGDNYEELVHRADEALYKAKRDGKNRLKLA